MFRHRKSPSRKGGGTAVCSKEERKVLRINRGLAQQHWTRCIVLVASSAPFTASYRSRECGKFITGRSTDSLVRGTRGSSLFLFDIIGWIMTIERTHRKYIVYVANDGYYCKIGISLDETQKLWSIAQLNPRECLWNCFFIISYLSYRTTGQKFSSLQNVKSFCPKWFYKRKNDFAAVYYTIYHWYKY